MTTSCSTYCCYHLDARTHRRTASYCRVFEYGHEVLKMCAPHSMDLTETSSVSKAAVTEEGTEETAERDEEDVAEQHMVVAPILMVCAGLAAGASLFGCVAFIRTLLPAREHGQERTEPLLLS